MKWNHIAVGCVALAAVLIGCSATNRQARQFEDSGQPQLAYESYRKTLNQDPTDGTAAEGLARTAPQAVEYWLTKAKSFEEGNAMEEAAECHRKALRIKPDEMASIAWLRDHRMDQAAKVDTVASINSPRRQPPTRVTIVNDPNTTATVGVLHASLNAPSASPAASAPAPSPVAVVAPSPVAVVVAVPSPTPAPVAAPSPSPVAVVVALPSPTPEPVVAPAPATAAVEPAASPSPAPVAAETGTVVAEARTVREVSVEGRKAAAGPTHEALAKQRPIVRYERNSSLDTFVVNVRISNDDKRFPKFSPLVDGLSVRIRDTDANPLDADMEFYFEDKRVGGKVADLPIDSVVSLMGRSGRTWEVVVVGIFNKTETVTLGIRERK